MFNAKLIPIALLTTCVAFTSRTCDAAESVNASIILSPYVNDDTFAAAYIDAAQAKVAENLNAAARLLQLPPNESPKFSLGAMTIDGMLRRFEEAGGRGIFLVAGLADIHIGGGPIAVATTQAGKSPEKVEQLLRDVLRELSPILSHLPNNSDWQIEVVRRGDVVLLGTKATVARYTALKSSPRSNLLDPLSNLINDGAIASLVYCPGLEYRRVTRELWPKLPGALAPLRGEVVDEWLHIEAAINAPPDARPRIAVQAKDTSGAEVFAKLWRDLPIAVTEFDGNEQSRQFAKGAAQLLVDSLPVEVQGTRAMIRVPSNEQQLTKLRDIFAEAAEKSMQVRLRKERMSQFKQLALGLQLYEDRNRHLPTVGAIRDKDGKPLLSWRVALLPFIEQKALFDQFHLDEPWDSPHNKPLITKIPALYTDLDPKLSELARAGKTTYQLPVSPQTIFSDDEGTKFSQITDGLHRTIAIVEVDQSRAVEWTRPSDWEVELDNPKAGLVHDRGVVTAAFADGHVELINLEKTSDKQLSAMLTRAGGDDASQ